MVAPLRKEKHDEQNHVHAQEKYHTFQDFSYNAKFRDLIFFARITLFAILTIFTAFVLLTLNLPTILVFLFSILISLAVTSTVSTFLWYLLK